MAEQKTVKKGERVVCYSCGQHILKADFGGIVKTEEGAAYTHNSLPCVLAFKKLIDATTTNPNLLNNKEQE